MTDTDQAGTALTVAEDQPPPIVRIALQAGATPRPLVPVDFDGAYRIANVVVRAGMAPKTLNTVEKAMVAILHGLEVGLTPMNALQSIAVINGRPTIWGDGAIGLIRASGLLEYMDEHFEGTGEKLTAVCIVKRKGEPKPVRGEFSWSDVLRAKLNGKEGPWQTYPRRMMQMRARWPLRDVFADVLKGLALKEEVEDMERAEAASPAEARAEPRRAPPPPEQRVAPVERKEVPSDDFPGDKPMDKEPVADDPISTGKAPAPPPEKSSDELWLDSLANSFGSCEDADTLASEQTRLMTPRKGKVGGEAWNAAVDLVKKHFERVSKDS